MTHASGLGCLLHRMIELMRFLQPNVEKQFGLSDFELLVLSIPNFFGAQTVSEIAKLLGVKLPTVSSCLKKLSQKDLVVTSLGKDDKRIHLVTLTKHGRLILRKREMIIGSAYEAAGFGFENHENGTPCRVVKEIDKIMEIIKKKGYLS